MLPPSLPVARVLAMSVPSSGGVPAQWCPQAEQAGQYLSSY